MTSGADPAVLLQGLALFLGQTVRPAVGDKATAFRVRIAEHLAMSLALQLNGEEQHDRDSVARLCALLDEPSDAVSASQLHADNDRLSQALAKAIRQGDVLPGPQLHQHLKSALIDELSITNPRFDLRLDLP